MTRHERHLFQAEAIIRRVFAITHAGLLIRAANKSKSWLYPLFRNSHAAQIELQIKQSRTFVRLSRKSYSWRQSC